MADDILSNRADADLDGIYVYSWQTFGEARADEYYLGICERLKSLVNNPRQHGYSPSYLPGLAVMAPSLFKGTAALAYTRTDD